MSNIIEKILKNQNDSFNNHHKKQHDMESSYLLMAKNGHYPLFEKNSIRSICDDNQFNLKKAKKILKQHFAKLNTYSSHQKRLVYLESLQESTMESFIKAFMKVAEDNIIDENIHIH